MTTTIQFDSNTVTDTNDILNNMLAIIQFVVNNNVAGEPLTATQLANLKTRFFQLRDSAVTKLQSMSP